MEFRELTDSEWELIRFLLPPRDTVTFRFLRGL